MKRPLLRRAQPNKIGPLTVFWNHAWELKLAPKVTLAVWHRMRASRFWVEWHKWNGVCYVEVGVADPKIHRKWATKATLELPWLPGKDRCWSWRA